MMSSAAPSPPTRGRIALVKISSGISAVNALDARAIARSKPATRWKRLTTRRTKSGRSQNVSVRRMRSRSTGSLATAPILTHLAEIGRTAAAAP